MGCSCGKKEPLPEWFRQAVPEPLAMERMRSLLAETGLKTVCQGAHCPNTGECWSRGLATFMILGDKCTRACRFCAVEQGAGQEVSCEEPLLVAEAVRRLGLKYVVITSVTRDDLPDGGAEQFNRTVRAIRAVAPECGVELLIPDFSGDEVALDIVLESGPQVLGHNIETVRRLSAQLRSNSGHDRSLAVLRRIRALGRGVLVKSGFMVGLGETAAEIFATLQELKSAGCDIVTIGQYLSPSKAERHFPVARFVEPGEFALYREAGLKLGIRYIASGALVRSSYMAEEGFKGCCAQ
ncbi:MAG: lipoyl synthase [Candidatus Omnitrophica bacterium]|nr:lipoyl synthase [Candidatus Omnitrophota bacterium]